MRTVASFNLEQHFFETYAINVGTISALEKRNGFGTSQDGPNCPQAALPPRSRCSAVAAAEVAAVRAWHGQSAASSSASRCS